MEDDNETKSERGARMIESVFFGKVAYAFLATILAIALIIYLL